MHILFCRIYFIKLGRVNIQQSSLTSSTPDLRSVFEKRAPIYEDIVSLPKTTNELREMANYFNTPTLSGGTGDYKQRTRGKR